MIQIMKAVENQRSKKGSTFMFIVISIISTEKQATKQGKRDKAMQSKRSLTATLCRRADG